MEVQGAGGVCYTIVLCTADPWIAVTEACTLRDAVHKSSGMGAPPAVLCRKVAAGQEPVAIMSGFGTDKEELVCAGATVDVVTAAFAAKFGGGDATTVESVGPTTSVSFTTDQDREGLLAEVSGLFKLHGVDIRSADISTAGSSTKHVYQVVDKATGKRLDQHVVETLQAHFAIIRDSDPNPTMMPDMVAKLQAQVAELTQRLDAANTENARLSQLAGGAAVEQLAAAAAEGPQWEMQRSDGSWIPAPFKPPADVCKGKKGKFEFQGISGEMTFLSEATGIVISKGKEYPVRLKA